jgi:hypothetical protein
MAHPKYDVAISFLTADDSTAASLHDALSEGLEIFYYPRKQEVLAGTNGLESMRKPFLEESRVVVVLYREPWGETPWTRVEQTAIQDRCLTGFNWLFFMMLDKTSTPPPWLPVTHVRFNYADYGLEQAVGAIKARVQESGGAIMPPNALKRAELANKETQYLEEREYLRSPHSLDIIRRQALDLFSAINRLCEEMNASGIASIEVASEAQQCHLRNHRVSLLVTLLEASSGAMIVVRDFSKQLPFRGEQPLFYPDGDALKLRQNSFLPDMNRAREYGWIEKQQPTTFLSTEALADTIVSSFVDLSAKADREQLNKAAPNVRRVRARFSGWR